MEFEDFDNYNNEVSKLDPVVDEELQQIINAVSKVSEDAAKSNYEHYKLNKERYNQFQNIIRFLVWYKAEVDNDIEIDNISVNPEFSNASVSFTAYDISFETDTLQKFLYLMITSEVSNFSVCPTFKNDKIKVSFDISGVYEKC